MVMWAAMSLAGSWPRAPQLFPTPSWFMPNLGESGVGSTTRAEEPAVRPVPAPHAPRCPLAHVCPISWAMVKAVARPMSSLMLQLLSRSHMPPTGARPGGWARGAGLGSGCEGWPSQVPTLPGPGGTHPLPPRVPEA